MISVIKSNFEPLPIGEVEMLLLVHEARMKKFQKRLVDSPLINVAQGYNSSSNSYSSSSNNFISQNRSNYSGNRGGGHRGGGRDRGGRYANFQCQVCYKSGHTAAMYHYRYDSEYLSRQFVEHLWFRTESGN